MNEYKVVTTFGGEEMTFVRRATSERDVRSTIPLLSGEKIVSITLVKRGVVEHDLSSGTSEC